MAIEKGAITRHNGIEEDEYGVYVLYEDHLAALARARTEGAANALSSCEALMQAAVEKARADGYTQGQGSMRERAAESIAGVRDEDLFEHSAGRVQDVLANIIRTLPVE